MDLDIIIVIIGAIFSGLMIAVAWSINRRTHPKALWLLFFTEMWERFSFYGMRALLILYMTHQLGFHDKEANLQYGAYNALVYTMPLLGGWLADRFLGFRKSIVLGALLMSLGHLVLAIPSHATFFLGLGLLISGNGFFKPNISSFLGKFYESNDPRKDTAYSIFYMGINVGAFLGSALCGYLGQKVSWHWGFGVAGFFMVIGLVTFLVFSKSVLGDKGLPPHPEVLAKKHAGIPFSWLLYGLAFLLVPVLMTLVRLHEITDWLLPILGVLTISSVIYLGAKEPKQAGEQLWAALIMIVLSILFWGFYEQSGGSLNLMAERNVDMNLGGTVLPSAMVNNSVNPFYIILLTPVFGWMWTWLSKRGIEPSSPLKFGIAFLLLGVGYYVFVLGGKTGAATGLMPLWFFLLGYFLITSGELFLSPIGVAMVTKLSPPRMVGFLMGVWFLAAAFGHHLAGFIGSKMAIPETHKDGTPFALTEALPIYMNGCHNIALASFAAGFVIICLAPFIQKWMHGVK